MMDNFSINTRVTILKSFFFQRIPNRKVRVCRKLGDRWSPITLATVKPIRGGKFKLNFKFKSTRKASKSVAATKPEQVEKSGADKSAPAVKSDTDKSAPVVKSGIDKSAPVVKSGTDKLAPVVKSGTDKLAPIQVQGTPKKVRKVSKRRVVKTKRITKLSNMEAGAASKTRDLPEIQLPVPAPLPEQQATETRTRSVNKVEALKSLIGNAIFHPKPLVPKLRLEPAATSAPLSAAERLKLELQKKIDEGKPAEAEAVMAEPMPGEPMTRLKFCSHCGRCRAFKGKKQLA